MAEMGITSMETGIKQHLRLNLAEKVKELQNEKLPSMDKRVDNIDVANQICCAIEAILIHDLRLSFIGKFSSSFRGRKRKFDVNFWMFALIFSHHDVISQIENFQHITTDVGKCRAWIRLALNDGVLGSYLTMMKDDSVSTKNFYEPDAIIRDTEAMGIIIKFIHGIEVYDFKLACNSSILNKWSTAPLELAGIISSSKQPLIVSGVDIASTITDEDETRVELVNDEQTESNHQISSMPCDIMPLGLRYLSRGLLNEDEALRLILNSTSPAASFTSSASSTLDASSSFKLSAVMSPNKTSLSPLAINSVDFTVSSDDVINLDSNQDVSVDTVVVDDVSFFKSVHATKKEDEEVDVYLFDDYYQSNSGVVKNEEVISRLSCHEEQSSKTENQTSLEVVPNSSEDTVPSMDEDGQVKSLEAVEKFIRAKSIRPCLSGFIESWDPFRIGKYFDTLPKNWIPNAAPGFSIRSDRLVIEQIGEEETQHMMGFFDIITHELGLNNQNYECYGCTKAIGTLFGPALVCCYTKKYYCSECHSNQLSIIPYKVVYSWDFNTYKVCNSAKIFIDAVLSVPLIDIQSTNGPLFEYVAVLDDILALRRQLNFMYAYLTTCTITKRLTKLKGQRAAKKILSSMLEPRQYLYTDIHVYSINDLKQVNSGVLQTILMKATRFCRDHIGGCMLCRGKGFICEVCSTGAPIYPFDLDFVSQCQKCCTVFHLACSVGLIVCPKCDRIESRNLKWLVSDSLTERKHAGLKSQDTE